MNLRSDELARRDAAVIHFRPEPVRAVWHFHEIASSDSHLVEGRFECSVRVASHAADRRILTETLLGNSDSVTVEHVIQRLASALRTSLCELIGVHSARDAVDPAHHGAWLDAIRKAGDAVAFASGLELLAPLQLHLHSPTLHRQQQREIAGARHRDDLQRATELLRQFQNMREAAPQLSAGQLLDRFAPHDRGLAFQSLLLAESGSSRAASLFAVAGPTLAKLDPRRTPPAIELHPLPTDLGPLRSVQSATIGGRDILLIGAQRGVMIVDPANVGSPQSFVHPELASPLGFNRVIHHAGGLWASHSEAGLVHWQLDAPAAPDAVFDEPEARNLEAFAGSRLIYSSKNDVVIRDGPSRRPLELPGASPVLGIIPLQRRVAVLRENGQIQLVDDQSLRLIDTVHRGTILRAAATMPWQGDLRLLLATDQGTVDCIGLDDPLVTQYLSAHRGLKMLAATTDLLAAVSPDRQRIIVWNNFDGQRPVGEIHLTSQTRHRIADICFVAAQAP